MIKKSLKLSKGEVDVVKKNGAVYKAFPFTFVYMKDKNQNFGKFSVIVSKRISKLAVQRNNIKRMVFDSIPKYFKKLNNINLIMIPHPNTNLSQDLINSSISKFSDHIVSLKNKPINTQ